MAEAFLRKTLRHDKSEAGALSRRTDGQEYPEYTPDFIRLAESYGAKGIRVTEKDQIAAAFEEAKKNTKNSYDHRIYH